MIDKIKSKLASKKLKELNQNRQVVLKSFNNIQTIGLIYVHEEEKTEDIRQCRLFADSLKQQGKQVRSLVLVPAKTTPEKLQAKLNIDYVNLSDRSKLGIPSSYVIDSFVSEAFDLLIVASIKGNDYLSMINLQSKAKLKIGVEHRSHLNSFDLQIILNEENNLRYLLEQIEFYLKAIKTA
jgi:hypothetical protein